MRKRLWFLAGVVVFGTPFVAAQATDQTLSDGNVFYTLSAGQMSSGSPFSESGLGHFRVGGAASTDHLYQNQWAYRVDSQTLESSVRNADATFNFSGTTGVVDVPVVADGLHFRLTIRVEDTDGPGTSQGRLMMNMRVTNTGLATRAVNLFNYADWDLAGTIPSDTATAAFVGGDMVMNAADVPGSVTLQSRGFGVDRWYNGEAFNLVANGLLDNLSNSAAVASPGNLAQAFQWTFNLNPNQSQSFEASWGIGTTAPVPEPFTLGFGAAALGLALRRRRLRAK